MKHVAFTISLDLANELVIANFAHEREIARVA
jgi:hypothetical protein